MKTRRFFIADPPFKVLASHLIQDEDFVEDAKTIVNLDEVEFKKIANQLSSSSAFLNRATIASIVGEVFGESKESETLTLLIYTISELIHESGMDPEEAMNVLEMAIKRESGGFSNKERDLLVDRLRNLCVKPAGIAKHFKAQQLVDVIGANLEDFKIICDIRPIFDRTRELIDGAIPITILQMEYSRQDNETEVLEVQVTEEQIIKIGEKIADANLKIKMIKELLNSHKLPIPKTKSTIQ